MSHTWDAVSSLSPWKHASQPGGLGLQSFVLVNWLPELRSGVGVWSTYLLLGTSLARQSLVERLQNASGSRSVCWWLAWLKRNLQSILYKTRNTVKSPCSFSLKRGIVLFQHSLWQEWNRRRLPANLLVVSSWAQARPHAQLACSQGVTGWGTCLPTCSLLHYL